MPHRKWRETKQQPSMLPGPAVPGCCLISFHFLWAILCPQAVHVLYHGTIATGFVAAYQTHCSPTCAVLTSAGTYSLHSPTRVCNVNVSLPLSLFPSRNVIHLRVGNNLGLLLKEQKQCPPKPPTINHGYIAAQKTAAVLHPPRRFTTLLIRNMTVSALSTNMAKV